MPRRRVRLIALCLLAAVLSFGLVRAYFPPLSPDEARLLGQWMTPEPNPGAAYVTAKGPVTHPRLVWEFRRDRSFRVRVTSADDPGVSIPTKEGLWSAGDGELHVEGFGAIGDALREGRELLRVRFGGTYVGRSSGRLTHAIRFVGPDSWTMTTAQGVSITWQRRP